MKIAGINNENKNFIFHAGTSVVNNEVVTSGGRVINVVGFGENLKQAINAHIAKWTRDAIRVNNKIEQTNFIFSKFFDNKEDSHLLKFYQGEIYRLKKEEKNNEKAIELYKESIEENDNFPDVYRELGLLLLMSLL